jgi:uncharacterized surface protein with fasciclin (FAS1) repeats
MKKIGILTAIVVLLLGCDKEDNKNLANEDISNRLNFVIEDNKANFASFSNGLSRTAYRYLLSEPGPYTVLLPDNNAFVAAGYPNPDAVLTASGTLLNNLIPYHVTHGTWELDKLPYRFNQELESIAGTKLYVTRWIKNEDTLVTINGTRVISYNLKASNGVIQVINTVLQPMVHASLSEAIAANSSLTYLNAALQRGGMKASLAAANSTYTIFAPDNAAFIAAGYATIQDINNADAAVIKRLLEYTMFSERKFIYDYVLTTDATAVSEQRMMSGSNITVTLTQGSVGYDGITIRGIGNTTQGRITTPNILAGNGVMHITNTVLKETF